MALPTFLVIGVEKAGTTSIYHYLKQHPEIYMSPVKETNFLERDWETVDPQTKARKTDRIDRFEKYCQLFEGVTTEKAIGEISPNYLFHYQSAIPRILQYVPDVKLMAILRHPAERAYSDYLMHLRDAIGNSPTLSEQVKTRSNSSFTLKKGLYYQPLKHYFEQFGRDRLRVFLYDDLCRDAVGMMQSMYRFLEVDDSFCPDMSKRSQVAQVPKSQLINSLLRQKNSIRAIASSTLRVLLPLEYRQKLRQTLIDWNSQSKDQAPLSPEERQQLINFYHDDILQLQDLLQRDLSSWLT
jgi:hypothetical protein